MELSKETDLSHSGYNEGRLSRAIRRTSYFRVVTDTSSVYFKHVFD